MRVPWAPISIRRLMACIALWAASLAIVVQAPFIALIIVPLIGSLWEARRGGKGLIGGMIGGTIAWVCLGLILLIWEYYNHGAFGSAANIHWLLIVFVVYTLGGAVIGLAEGIAFYFVRYLATLPKLILLRAERSARANSYGSTSPSHDD
jgi:hypothetical protein